MVKVRDMRWDFCMLTAIPQQNFNTKLFQIMVRMSWTKHKWRKQVLILRRDLTVPNLPWHWETNFQGWFEMALALLKWSMLCDSPVLSICHRLSSWFSVYDIITMNEISSLWISVEGLPLVCRDFMTIWFSDFDHPCLFRRHLLVL